METSKILEGNKLIAEFMGMKKGHPDPNERRWENDWFESLNPGGGEFESGNRHKYLFFDSEWNWLMPVVEKIESMKYFFNSAPFIDDETGELTGEYFCAILFKTTNLNCGHFIDVTGCSSKIEATWKAVVEFIKWYNGKNS
jgi:hypothetical protein